MECDEHTPRKKPSIDVEEDVIDLKKGFNFEFDSLKIMIEEEPSIKIPAGGEAENQVVVA